MKAVLLREFGGPEKLSYEDVADVAPAPGEIVIRVAAVSINRSFDLRVRSGQYGSGLKLPLVLGADPTGTIVAKAPDVGAFRVGDRVAVMSSIACRECAACRSGDVASCTSNRTIGVHRWGGYAEYVAVPAVNAACIPDGLSFNDATVIARHGSAAYNFVVRRGGLRMGETALILGAAGALGGMAVQVARLAGARVIAAAGSDDRAEAALPLGAHDAFNYRRDNLRDKVAALTGGRGVDLAFDASADPLLWPQALHCLAGRGRIVCAGAHAGGEVTLDVNRLYRHRLQVIGAAGTTVSDLDFALAAGAEGKLKARIHSVVPLHEAASAHRQVEAGQLSGKVLLTPEP